MAFVDEKIAALERARRLTRRDAEEKVGVRAEEGTNEDVLTLEEIQKGIAKGQVEIEGQLLAFEKQIYFDHKLPLLIIKDFFDEVKIEKQALLFVSNTSNLCMMCTYLDENLPEKSIEVRQKEMEENFLKMNMYAEILKVECLKHLDYIVYRTPTGKGWVYNIVYWVLKNERRIVGNMNCLDKQKDTYGLLIEALIIETNHLME